MLRNLRNQKGFTLIELMIVVAIIGILAAIAIPNFMTFRMKAKTAEAKSNLGSIRTCEEAYNAEKDVYLDCDAQPTTAPGAEKQPWVADNTFSLIGFVPSGNVYYQYEVDVADGTKTTAFTATATGNLDGDTSTAVYTVSQAGEITGPTGDDW